MSARPTVAGVLEKLEVGRELDSLTDVEIDVLVAGLLRLKKSRTVRDAFWYFSVYADARLLRAALVEDLSTWISAGFTSPENARRWQDGVRRLEAIAKTRRNLVIDQLYADAALVLGVNDDAELVRVSELA